MDESAGPSRAITLVAVDSIQQDDGEVTFPAPTEQSGSSTSVGSAARRLFTTADLEEAGGGTSSLEVDSR